MASPTLGGATSPAAALRVLLNDAKDQRRCLLMPACHDAISAALIARAGFRVGFMSGFAVSAASLALPDAGIISYAEMLAAGRAICEAGRGMCVVGDGDTGFGGPANIRRAVEGYARAGFAGMSIEDQVYPKRCSLARGVSVISRDEAIARVRAAVTARDEMKAASGLDLVVIGRTDCRHAPHGGLDEAVARCHAFAELGADLVYAEGLGGEDEFAALHAVLPAATPTMLAQVERPSVQLLSSEDAARHGFTLCLHGLTVFSASVLAMKRTLTSLAAGAGAPADSLLPLDELHAEVGFPQLYAWEARLDDRERDRTTEP